VTATPAARIAQVSGVADRSLIDRVRMRLVAGGMAATPAAIATAVREEAGLLGDAAVLSVVEALRPELVGIGPLEALVSDPAVTDVLVNGPDEVWVDRGSGLEPAGVRFRDEAAVRRLAQRLAVGGGRRLDDASPYVDARLSTGLRLHAVIPPISPGGTCISLRVPRRRGFTLDQLVEVGTLVPAAAVALRGLVEARAAFLVSGGAGTGKTTILATLLSQVPEGERIVLVEDSAELRPDHPHVVRLESRRANLDGAGAVSLRDLVRQALRMRPDRLVVGEVRGGEVVELLAALNTGHDGGCGTIHANSSEDVPARVEALAVAAGLGREAVHSQLAAGVQAVVHLLRDPGGRRRVASIGVVEREPSGLVAVVPAVEFAPHPVERPGSRALASLIARATRTDQAHPGRDQAQPGRDQAPHSEWQVLSPASQ
jgi:pilus assembly protein CpaF